MKTGPVKHEPKYTSTVAIEKIKLEQKQKIKSDLEEALNEVALLTKNKVRKQTFSDFLNEL